MVSLLFPCHVLTTTKIALAIVLWNSLPSAARQATSLTGVALLWSEEKEKAHIQKNTWRKNIQQGLVTINCYKISAYTKAIQIKDGRETIQANMKARKSKKGK